MCPGMVYFYVCVYMCAVSVAFARCMLWRLYCAHFFIGVIGAGYKCNVLCMVGMRIMSFLRGRGGEFSAGHLVFGVGRKAGCAKVAGLDMGN